MNIERSSHQPPQTSAQSAKALDDWPNDYRARLDSDLRIVLDLIERHHWPELAQRTGIVVKDRLVVKDAPPQPFPLVIKLREPKNDKLRWTSADVESEFVKLNVQVASTIYSEIHRTKQELRRLPAWVNVNAYDPGQVVDEPASPNASPGDEVMKNKTLIERLKEILAVPFVERIALSGSHLPCLDIVEDAFEDVSQLIGLPANREYASESKGKTKRLTGSGIVIGIIDDGCPFAHQDFVVNGGSARNPAYKTRVKSLWDQNALTADTQIGYGWISAPATKSGYDPAKTPGYGRIIHAPEIDLAISKFVSAPGWIDEQGVYEYLGYPVEGVAKASHGGRVAGIAAGNGRSVMGREGVAPKADIVFVQLPKVAIESNPATLDRFIVEALSYIFAYADYHNKRAVINLSYGGYSGGHDGSGDVETAIDAMLTVENRAVVVSAGNGFEADCHAHAGLIPGERASRTWIIQPEDASRNEMEIWYPDGANVSVALMTPDGVTTYGPYTAPVYDLPLLDASGGIIGYIDFLQHGNGDWRAMFSLLPNTLPQPLTFAAPPSGAWRVTLTNVGTTAADVHAWIRRDDQSTLQQSRFAPDDAHPGYTLADFASGKLSFAIGAWNCATGEVGRYSAAGPLRIPNGSTLPKPLCLAPGESLPHGKGVLGTSSGSGQPRRLGGTSASAPFVTGIVALVFEFAAAVGIKKLSASTIAAAMQNVGFPKPAPNQHQQASRYPPIKQYDIWQDVIGLGAIGCAALLESLYP